MPHNTVLIWDLPTRVFHWLLALCFAGAYISAEWDDWRILHVTLGASVGLLVLFRLLWGFVGTRHARFSEFAFGRTAVAAYLRALLRRQPQHHAGHTPAGSWAIWLMLGLGLATALSGYTMANDIGGDAVEEIHEVLANSLLAVVVVHVLGVIVASIAHRENLARAMVTGRKIADAADAIRSPASAAGVALGVAVLAFWLNAFGVRDAVVGTAQQYAEREHREEVAHEDD